MTGSLQKYSIPTPSEMFPLILLYKMLKIALRFYCLCPLSVYILAIDLNALISY